MRYTKQLFTSLVDKHIIQRNTKLDISAVSYTIGMKRIVCEKCVVVEDILKNKEEDSYSFKCYDINDGNKLKISYLQIKTIDGMAPDRIAEIYDIKYDGTFKKPKKKRGRKAKNIKET